MGTGYTRQSAAEIQTGEVIEAAPLNAEFNQLQNAFDSTVGHTHDGTVGEGPKINLTNSVQGVLPIANGGIAGIHKLNAIVNPAVTDDVNDGYAVGSIWVNVATDTVYICVDSTASAAVWITNQVLDAALSSIAGLTTSANQMIYTTASDTYATTSLTAFARTLLDDADASSALTTLSFTPYTKTLVDDVDAATARGTLGLGTMATQNANSVAITGGSIVASSATITGGTITGITDLAVADGGTGASDAAGARTNLGLVIGTDVQAQDSTLNAFAAYNTNGLLTQTAADTFTGRTLTGTSNEVTVTNGNGVSGNPTVSLPSALTLTGKTITGGTFSNMEGFTLLSTDAGAAVGPIVDVYRDSASPAASDVIGSVDFNGRDSAANKQLYGRIVATITDPTTSTEDASVTVQTVANGAMVNTAVFTGTAATINGTLTITG